MACPAVCVMSMMTRKVWLLETGLWTLDARPTEAGDVGRVRGLFCARHHGDSCRLQVDQCLLKAGDEEARLGSEAAVTSKALRLYGTSKTWSLNLKVVTPEHGSEMA